MSVFGLHLMARQHVHKLSVIYHIQVIYSICLKAYHILHYYALACLYRPNCTVCDRPQSTIMVHSAEIYCHYFCSKNLINNNSEDIVTMS